MNLKEIEARLAEINGELEKRDGAFSDGELDRLEAEVDSLKEQREKLVKEAEQRQKLLGQIAEGRPTDTGVPVTVRSFAEGSEPEDRYATKEYRRAFMDYVCRGKAIPIEYRDDSVTATTDVGAVIPTTVLNQIIEELESTGMILPLITRTSYKGGVSIPVSSVKPTATWVKEGSGSDKQKLDTTGSVTFSYYKLRCAVAVTLEVDTMAMSAFEALLTRNITEAMAKALEQAIIDGDGSGKPTGILTNTPADGQEIEVAEVSYSDLVNAEAALPLAYENGAVWCMSKKTFMAYYGLLDSNGQPIGRVNYGIEGKPERTLLGRPVICCDYVASYSESLDADTVFGFLFDFKDYVLNTNYSIGLKKYEDNDTDDIVTKAIMLVDGKAVTTGSLVTLKKIASA